MERNLNLFFCLIFLLICSITAQSQVNKVEVIKNSYGNFELQRNGKPYYIKGAGAKDHFELLNSDVEAISVCLPDRNHVQVCCDVANAKKHILVEKPIAHDFISANQIIEICKKNTKHKKTPENDPSMKNLVL